MESEMDDKELQGKLEERLKSLPKVVQNAITSAGVESHLRMLAETHKLHLDQWQVLENNVMLTLLGFQDPKELKQNIKDDVGVSDEIAGAIAADISRIVFEPIREELERALEHPDAQAKDETGVEKMTAQILAPAPIAPIPTNPDSKAIRAPLSDVYKAGETSTDRKTVHSDPYRESPT